MNLISTLVILDQRPKQIQEPCVEDCREINEQLLQILQDDVAKLKEAYSVLEPVISIQSRLRGPRNFRKLLNEIFQFIKIYSYDRIQAYEEHIVILNLTFYEKIFRFSFTPTQKVEALMIFAIANIHIFLRNEDTKPLSSASYKIDEMNGLSITENYFKNVLLLLTAIVTHLKGQSKRAKTMLANLLTKIIEQKKEVLKCDSNLEIMTICAFYSYQNYSIQNQYELSCYYLTKAHEFGKKLGQKAISFTQKVKEIGEHKAVCKVKLTRIQNKLQVLKRTKSSWHSKTMKPKIYNQKKTHDENEVKQQLKNIFTIKDTKATMYRFRKDNLRYLNGEETKLTANIQRKQEQLTQISKLRSHLGAGLEINKVQTEIAQIKSVKCEITSQYQDLKFKHLKEIKQVKVLNKFFKNFINLAEFKKLSYVYNFLYGQMFSRAKIFILSLFMKRRVRKIKRTIRKQKINLRGIVHFFQIFQILENDTELLIYKKKQPGYYLRIYPIEKKDGIVPVQDEKKLSKSIFQKLISIPLCYEFELRESKLLNWNQYIGLKNFFTIHYVKKFIQRLTKKYKNKDNPETYKILTVYLKFQNHLSIETKLFACISQSQENSSFLSTEPRATVLHGNIYTIGGPRYQNGLYNLSINSCLTINLKTDLNELALELVREQLMSNCFANLDSIKKIQRFIKSNFCKKKMKMLRVKNKIFAVVNGNDVITYCRYSTGKSLIIVENIVTKDREVIETLMDFNSFKTVSLIKDKLSKEKTCKDKLKMTCKYIWTRFFVTKLKDHIQKSVIMTEFQISFRNRLVFVKEFTNFIYKKKLVFSKIVFSLTGECLLQFPRPYTFRIYTVQESSTIVDVVIRIYNRDKQFYEKNLEVLNRIVNVLSKTQIEVICQSDQIEVKGRHRNSRNSRSSRMSTSMLHSITNFSSEDQVRTISQIVPKVATKKTSMLARFRSRRSNKLTLQPQLQNQSQTFSNYSMENKGEIPNIL